MYRIYCVYIAYIFVYRHIVSVHARVRFHRRYSPAAGGSSLARQAGVVSPRYARPWLDQPVHMHAAQCTCVGRSIERVIDWLGTTVIGLRGWTRRRRFLSVFFFFVFIMASKRNKKLQVFKEDYTRKWKCIVPSSKSANHARCTLCLSEFNIGHGGGNDIQAHLKTVKHQTVGADSSSSFPMWIYYYARTLPFMAQLWTKASTQPF